MLEGPSPNAATKTRWRRAPGSLGDVDSLNRLSRSRSRRFSLSICSSKRVRSSGTSLSGKAHVSSISLRGCQSQQERPAADAITASGGNGCAVRRRPSEGANSVPRSAPAPPGACAVGLVFECIVRGRASSRPDRSPQRAVRLDRISLTYSTVDPNLMSKIHAGRIPRLA